MFTAGFYTAANLHPETGIRYSYVSANELDCETVDDLMYNHVVEDYSFDEWLKEQEIIFEAEQDEREALAEDAGESYEREEFDPNDCDMLEQYEEYEPEKLIKTEGFTLRSSWLGGALHFYVIESPLTAPFPNCSPCVPNAGCLTYENLLESQKDQDHGITLDAYVIPVEWFHEYRHAEYLASLRCVGCGYAGN